MNVRAPVGLCRKRPPLRRGTAGLAVLSAWLLFVGCSSGELNLSVGEEETDRDVSVGGQDVSVGGQESKEDDSVGGQDSKEEDSVGGAPASGGADGIGGAPSLESGGTVGAGGHEHLDEHIDPPCIVGGYCECGPKALNCASCDDASTCGHGTPFCDNSLDHCVECLGDNDCTARFDDDFGLCSGGRCVQCQTQTDCSDGKYCDHGFCGRCENDSVCQEGEVCAFGHCIAVEYLPPPPPPPPPLPPSP